MTDVLHISTSDIWGGAAIAAYRLHNALRREGVRSRMLVQEKRSTDPDVMASRSPGSAGRLLLSLQGRRYSLERALTTRAVSPELAYFSDDRVPGPNLLSERPGADVINLHWVAHLLDYGRFFGNLRPGQPLVWTLHDMAPLTGGCHYAMRCDRFTDRCGACPLLGSQHSGDLTRRIHDRKAAALSRLSPARTRIVAPSRWLAGEARKSTLLGGFNVEVIPNGLDTGTFAPRDRDQARAQLGLPGNALTLLFAADHVGDHRKGMDLLLAALDGLALARPVSLLALGAPVDGLPGGSISLGHVDDPQVMSQIYSAADVFVLPTRADNLPNVLLEAMACGVPSVSFRIGGVPDAVREGETGLLAEPEDVGSLRSCLSRLLEDDALRQTMRTACRQIALRDHADHVIAGRYARLYDGLLNQPA